MGDYIISFFQDFLGLNVFLLFNIDTSQRIEVKD